MPASLRTFTNDFWLFVDAGPFGFVPDPALVTTEASQASDAEGLGRPVPRPNVLAPGTTSIWLTAQLFDAGGSDLGVHRAAATVCALLEYLGSGAVEAACLENDEGFFQAGGFPYRSGIDGDVRVTFTVDLQGDGIQNARTDAIVTRVYDDGLP